MKLYKLTEQNNTTYQASMTWEIGTTNSIKECNNPQLCSSDVIHAYKNKNLALLLNPIHANISDPVLYECSGNIVVKDFGKCGIFSLTPTKKLKHPKWYTNPTSRNKVEVQFAVLCALAVIDIYRKQYPGEDRPDQAIKAAQKYLTDAATDAAYVRSGGKALDFYCSTILWLAGVEKKKKKDRVVGITINDDAAAYAAAYAARAAYAAYAAADAAYAAAYAARAAYAAYAAADAADAADAARTNKKINFCELADTAVKMIMKRAKQ